MSIGLYSYEKRKRPEVDLVKIGSISFPCKCKGAVLADKDILESEYMKFKGKTFYITTYMRCLKCKEYKELPIPTR